MSVQVFSTAAGSFTLKCGSNLTKPWELKLICQNPFIVLSYRSYSVLTCCPTKVRDAVGEYILLFSITTTANGGGAVAVAAYRGGVAAAAAARSSSSSMHGKLHSSTQKNIVFSNLRLLLFPYNNIPLASPAIWFCSKPAIMPVSNIICYEHNQPTIRLAHSVLLWGFYSLLIFNPALML